MASLCLNSLPVPPSSLPRKPTETSLSSYPSLLLHNNNNNLSDLKPIVVSGDPPTFVSAPGRRILAGLLFLFQLCFCGICLVLNMLISKALNCSFAVVALK